MKPRVLLFNLPPSGGDLFPISLGYIAASLVKQGIKPAIAEIDRITPRTGQSIADFVLEFKPRVVGFSVYQDNTGLAVQLAKLVKMIDPGILVVIGGPQATFMPAGALLQMQNVDVICRGEGELILPALVKCLIQGGGLSGVNGISFKDNTCLRDTPDAPLIKNLDDLPSAYRSGAFDFKDHKTATMLTSRGCRYTCSFCYTPRAFRRTIRAHSPRRVLDDMRVCVEHGIKRFFFADPSFTYDRKRVEEIMRGIIRWGWKVEIWCETRTDLVDAELLALMARAGVNRIAYGLESVDPAVLKAVNKPLDIRRFEEMVKVSQDLGIYVEIFTLYGLPEQTIDSCCRTIDFLKRLKIPFVGNSAGQQLVLFYGTDITDHPEKFGIRLQGKKKPLYLSAGSDFVTEHMDKRAIALAAKRYKAAGRSQKVKPKKGECIVV
ncbi:MAG: radical SAM protein [Candidatus Omnitrophota bacterium]|jgi:radical SAM superfamily enzyme YgiQ (UPF0313 family)